MTQDEYQQAKEFLAKRGLIKFASKPEVIQAMVEYGDWRVEQVKSQAKLKEKSCSDG